MQSAVCELCAGKACHPDQPVANDTGAQVCMKLNSQNARTNCELLVPDLSFGCRDVSGDVVLEVSWDVDAIYRNPAMHHTIAVPSTLSNLTVGAI